MVNGIAASTYISLQKGEPELVRLGMHGPALPFLSQSSLFQWFSQFSLQTLVQIGHGGVNCSRCGRDDATVL